MNNSTRITLLAGLVFLLGIGSSVAQTKTKHPNIIFLLSDDQRADTIAAWGNKNISTPNLDGLVSEGISFTNTYCMGGLQGAVCVPSRAMMMTGKTLFRVKENLADEMTWPQTFAQNGYATFGIGKWHNTPPSYIKTFQEGKAVFFGGMNDPYSMPL